MTTTTAETYTRPTYETRRLHVQYLLAKVVLETPICLDLDELARDDCNACGDPFSTGVELTHRPHVCTCTHRTRPTKDDPCTETTVTLICADCRTAAAANCENCGRTSLKAYPWQDAPIRWYLCADCDIAGWALSRVDNVIVRRCS